jgi:hypothetical protein
MSRTVETIGDNVIYFDASEFDEFDWSDLIINLQSELAARYKSFIKSEKFVSYPYRENRIILKNDHVQISISEYCGCGAVSIFVNRNLLYSDYNQYPELAEHWLSQCFSGIEKIIEQFVSPLHKVATFSNGEAVYERKK